MNYYEMLNINKDATAVEIKKSYRKLAMQWHPDRNNNSKESEEKFKQVKEAYETLSNQSARFWYDRELEENFGKSSNYSHNTNQSSNDNSNNENDEDINERENAESSNQKTSDEQTHSYKHPKFDEFSKWRIKYPFAKFHKYNLVITDEKSIIGGNVSFQFEFEDKGYITINVHIPSYVQQNSVLDMKINNDNVLLIFLSITENPNKKLDIHSNVDIDIFSALHGLDVVLPTTSGEHKVHIPHLTKHGDILNFLGLGLKGDFFVGTLYIKVNVYYPQFISDEQHFLLSQLSKIQRIRDKHIILKLINLFKEAYYVFIKPKK